MEKLLATAIEAAQNAGKRLVEFQGTAKITQKGSTQNLVTQADIESEQIIKDLISKTYPDHRVLCEEGQSTGEADDDHLWVIDPLDATNNYAHGIPHYSISIAYAEKGILKAAVVLDPTRDELFTAIKGQGAFLNDQPIHVSPSEQLQESIVGTGFYYDRGELMRKTLAGIDRLFSNNIRGIRRMGSAAIDLAWVACGRYEAFFEYKLAPWDYAAGILLIHEAGGRCSDRDGNPIELSSENIIATNSKTFDSILPLVKWQQS